MYHLPDCPAFADGDQGPPSLWKTNGEPQCLSIEAEVHNRPLRAVHWKSMELYALGHIHWPLKRQLRDALCARC